MSLAEEGRWTSQTNNGLYSNRCCLSRADGKGRPRRDSREVIIGILWVLRTGAPWEDLPGRYPPDQTCQHRFQEWVKAGAMEKVLCALATHLNQRGGIDLSESFIDGTFSPAKKGLCAGKTKLKPSAQALGIWIESFIPCPKRPRRFRYFPYTRSVPFSVTASASPRGDGVCRRFGGPTCIPLVKVALNVFAGCTVFAFTSTHSGQYELSPQIP
ncbi:MAG: transposase [Planctomycetes bacterium]|nr:transposase [Planctomycetota bacterium]